MPNLLLPFYAPISQVIEQRRKRGPMAFDIASEPFEFSHSDPGGIHDSIRSGASRLRPILIVTGKKPMPDIFNLGGYLYGVSDRAAQIFSELAPHDLQFIPVELRGPPEKKLAGPYFYMIIKPTDQRLAVPGIG